MAFQRGVGTELLGGFLHLIISMLWAVFFVLVLVRIPTVARHPVVWGIIAGIGVKFFMQYVIIPLGNAAGPHYNWLSLTNKLVAHTFFFGVPVLLVARRAYVGHPLTVAVHRVRSRVPGCCRFAAEVGTANCGINMLLSRAKTTDPD